MTEERSVLIPPKRTWMRSLRFHQNTDVTESYNTSQYSTELLCCPQWEMHQDVLIGLENSEFQGVFLMAK
jgi:hypothetical protein